MTLERVSGERKNELVAQEKNLDVGNHDEEIDNSLMDSHNIV